MAHVAVEAGDGVFEAIAGEPGLQGHARVVVRDETTAADSLRTALRGNALLIHAVAERATLDRLYDDLRRLAPVTVRTEPAPTPRAARLDEDETALLRLLATGLTLRDAAAELHVSPRTADRRLAGARAKLGVATTIEAVAAIAR